MAALRTMNTPCSAACDNLESDVPSELSGRQTLSLPVRITNLIAIVLPFVGLLTAIVLMWGWGFDWLHLGLLLGMYCITGLGITVGFHRLFTHRAFEAARPIRLALGVLGCMAVQGPILRWVATHRRHHQYSDERHDPHSPNMHGRGFVGLVKGMWHAHMGWMFKPDSPNLFDYVNDLVKDRLVRRVSTLFPLWVVVGLAIPTALGGLIAQSWTGALLGFIWGGLVRVFFVHHVTWSINSVCHIWGTRPFRSQDESRNNPIFGILGWGEGWHNNHHAFPTSARHGLRWWELDLSYGVIRALAALGLAWNVRTPSADSMALKKQG
jgi:stearoyl-CoA desaturase (delta-9 desaturase)